MARLKGKRVVWAVGIVWVISIGAGCSQFAVVPTYTDLPEYRLLVSVETFMLPNTGCDGGVPLPVFAWQTLLENPQADHAFKHLLAEGTLPGKLYAVCALNFTDAAAFSEAVGKFRADEARVSALLSGCIVETPKVSDIITEKLPPGAGPNQVSPGSIADGGLPALLRTARPPCNRQSGPGEATAEEPSLAQRIQQLKAPSAEERRRALSVLMCYGPWAHEAVPVLVELLKDDDLRVRIETVKVLGRIGPWAREAVPALAVALSEGALEVRREIPDALVYMGPWATEAIPALTGALWDEDLNARLEAAYTLAYLAPWAQSAIPDLSRKLTDGSEAEEKVGVRGSEVLDAVRDALYRIQNEISEDSWW